MSQASDLALLIVYVAYEDFNFNFLCNVLHLQQNYFLFSSIVALRMQFVVCLQQIKLQTKLAASNAIAAMLPLWSIA